MEFVNEFFSSTYAQTIMLLFAGAGGVFVLQSATPFVIAWKNIGNSNHKTKDKSIEETITPAQMQLKYLEVITQMSESVNTFALVASKSDATQTKLINTISNMSTNQTIEHAQVVNALSEVRDYNIEMTRAVTTMDNNLDEFTTKLAELIARWDDGITLSPETQKEVVDSISSQVSLEMKRDIAGNHNVLMSMIQEEFNKINPPKDTEQEQETSD